MLFRRDNKLMKRGEELFNQLSKELQVTSAQLCAAVKM
jgi:hypothetical protein